MRALPLVGESNETEAAALQRLIETGLVCRVELREGASGRFARSRYAVDLTAAGFSSAGPCTATDADSADTSARCSPGSAPVEVESTELTDRGDSTTTTTATHGAAHPNQLSLLDL